MSKETQAIATTPTTPEVISYRFVPMPGLPSASRVKSTAAKVANISDLEGAIRAFKAYYKDTGKDIRLAVKNHIAREKDELSPWEIADATVARAVADWLKAEMARVDREAKALLLQAQQDAETQRKQQVEELKQASKAAETPELRREFKEQAKAVAEAPLMPIISTVAKLESPKIAGISTPQYWSADVHDFKALVLAVVAGQAPWAAILPAQEWLDGQAIQLQDELSYPGVTAVKRTGLSARSTK